jgi:hypothetical protein
MVIWCVSEWAHSPSSVKLHIAPYRCVYSQLLGVICVNQRGTFCVLIIGYAMINRKKIYVTSAKCSEKNTKLV